MSHLSGCMRRCKTLATWWDKKTRLRKSNHVKLYQIKGNQLLYCNCQDFSRNKEAYSRHLAGRSEGMDSYKMITPMLMILLQCTIHVFGQMKFVDERFVNKTNIITRIPFTTITSCFMKCSQHEKCSAVGFSTDPTASRNSDCLLLEKIEDFGVEKAEGLVPMFVMMDVS